MSDSKHLMGRDITRAEFEQMKQAMAGMAPEQIAQMMNAMENAFGGGGEGEPEPATLDVPFPADLDEARVRAAMGHVRHGYGKSWFDKLKIDVELFWIPNPETLKVTIDWPDGPAPAEPGSLDTRSLVYSCEIECPEEELAAMAASLRPTLRLSTASAVKTLVFTAADVGKSRDGWTLVALDRGAVSVRRPPGAEDAILGGFDASGRRLDWSGTGTQVEHSSGKPLWELEWDDLTEDRLSTVMSATFRGRPTVIRVAVPVARVEASLPLKVVMEPKTGEGAPEGYRLAPGRAPRFEEFTEDGARERTLVRFSRNQAMMERGQPTVSLRLPDAGNSAYATVEFSEFVLEGDAGAIEGFELVDGGRDHAAHAENRRFTGPDGAMEFPGLRRIRGSARVKYPLRVDVFRGRRGKAGPVELNVLDGTVAVSYDPEAVTGLDADTASFLPDDLERIVARHVSGMLLQRLPFQGYHSTESGVRREFRFWGEPHEVEVRIPSDYVEFEVPIDVKVE